jgi:hypothetical protein
LHTAIFARIFPFRNLRCCGGVVLFVALTIWQLEMVLNMATNTLQHISFAHGFSLQKRGARAVAALTASHGEA